jgi:RimJ/RimL family protein N-acetyltransferase
VAFVRGLPAEDDAADPGRRARAGAVDRQPHLVGESVELRPLRAADFDELYAAASDPLIWEQHPVPDRHAEQRFHEYFDAHLASGGALAAIDLSTGRIVGATRFHGYDPERREVEIGWTFLARSHWGGAFNGEMKALMLEHAFRSVDRVLFKIHPDNVRSQRSVEKLGAVRAGTGIDGDGRESVVYVLSRPAR